MAGSDIILRDRFNVESVSNFLKSMKQLGLRSLPLLKKEVPIPYEKNQFVVAAIVSGEEIENEKFTVIIDDANHKLDDVGEDRSDIYGDYGFLFNRLVVLLNTPKPITHGEARLLDPDGKIRKEFLSEQDICLLNGDCNRNFLDELKKMFAEEFQNKQLSYIICIFSLNIPCTEPKHQCAKLIDEFSRKQSAEVIIGYEDVFYKTIKTAALSIMNKNNKIYCLELKESSIPPLTTKSSSQGSAFITKSNDKMEVLRGSRIAKKARQKRKYSNPSKPSEKKKPKSYDREKPDDS